MMFTSDIRPLEMSDVIDQLDSKKMIKSDLSNKRPNIVLTLAKSFPLSEAVKAELERACNIKNIAVPTVKDLFTHLTDSSKKISAVIIGGWPDILAETRLDLVEVINAVNTLRECSGYKFPIAVGINSTIDTCTIQQIKKLNIDYIWPGSMEFSVETKIETMRAILEGRKFTHPKLDSLLKPARAKKTGTAAMSLTPRQRQILDIVANRGASNKTIARMLNITESTVKLHMSGILKKYGVRNRTQLALFARVHAEA